MSQQILAYFCVALACGFLSWKGWKMLRPGGRSGCPGGCGCSSKRPNPPTADVISLSTNRLRQDVSARET